MKKDNEIVEGLCEIQYISLLEALRGYKYVSKANVCFYKGQNHS